MITTICSYQKIKHEPFFPGGGGGRRGGGGLSTRTQQYLHPSSYLILKCLQVFDIRRKALLGSNIPVTENLA